MSVVATALRELMALGVTGDALIAAVERIEQAATTERTASLREAVEMATAKADGDLAEKTARQERNRRYYEAKRLKASESKTIKTDQDVSDASKTLSDAAPHVCAQVVTLTSSLRSEGKEPPPTPNGVGAPKGAETARGCRLPEDWTPPAGLIAIEFGLSHERYAVEVERFRDYWRSVPGAKGRKADWPATWRNWLRRAAENSPRKAHDRSHDDKLSRKEANLARSLAGFDAVAGRRRIEP